ncbi:MAG TPA: hypothetical protein VGP25_07950, partial [Gemmatimonadaceae bacterium]|nr:hypothetical protein [Gemmatimonadaceae bacterium]
PTPASAISDRRLLGWGLLLTLLVGAFGLEARSRMFASGLARAGLNNIFFRLYALHELPFLVLLVSTTLLAAVVALRRPGADAAALAERGGPPSLRAVMLIALVVFVGALASSYLVHHSLLFAMDEFTTEFQARIFAAGRIRGIVPEAWRPIAPAMTPIFTNYHPETGEWVSLYLPFYALIKAPFVLLGAGVLLNPLLSAGSVLALAAVALRLWPDDAMRRWVAIAVLVTSSQFVLVSGTGYSMPAHLLLNLVWLWLYLRGDARSWAAALAVGVVALGLHNPFPHALFVAPFMLRLLRERRWARLVSGGVVYVAAAALLMVWMRMVHPLAGAGGPGVLSVFSLPGFAAIWLQLVHLTLLISWQAPLVGALAIAGYVRARRTEPVLADAGMGVLITLAFYAFFPLTQGHGWGYRYAHQILGNIALLAAAGVPVLIGAVGASRGRMLLAASCAVALVVQIPLRLVQTERFVRPFAAGHRLIAQQHADVVLVRGDSVWYGKDLIRNDPFLRGPVVIYRTMVSDYGRQMLEQAHPGRVVELRDADLLALGMTPYHRALFSGKAR